MKRDNLLDKLIAEYKQDRKKHPIKWMWVDFKCWVLTSINWVRIKLKKRTKKNESKIMRYLITTNIQPPFLSDWFDAENHFNPEVGMVVYDLAKGVYTIDGRIWEEIEEDHL